MSEKDFEPLTGQLGISGTSYSVQLGLINGKWAIKLMRGKEVIDCYIFKKLDKNQLPGSEEIIRWILNAIPLNINPHHVSKTAQILLKQAEENKNKKKVLAPIKDVRESKEKLNEVPKSDIKRPKAQGRVIENNVEVKTDETFVRTLKENINYLEQEIKTIKELMELKDVKIKHLEEQLELKGNELRLLNNELAKLDEELEFLKLENEKLKKVSFESSELDIFDFSKLRVTESEFKKEMRDILKRAKDNVTIISPKITDFEDLKVYEVRASVNLNLAALINPGIEKHMELLEELDSFENVQIRNYKGEDRYGLLRDGEELLFAAIGANGDNYLIFYTKNSAHIKLLKSLITDPWLRSRKI